MGARVQAIETVYAGCRFRSRLEARWAVFFDALKIEWTYEPEGFELPSGRYLPDFRFPAMRCWFEVKGTKPEDGGSERVLAGELASAFHENVFVAWGHHPHVVDHSGHALEPRRIDLHTGGDEGDVDMAFCACPWCGRIGIEYEGRGARICGWRAHHETEAAALAAIRSAGHWRADDKCYTGDAPQILSAYTAARSARFEFGESGPTARKRRTSVAPPMPPGFGS